MWLKKLVIIINQTWIHCFELIESQDYFITIWFHFHNKTIISADTKLGRRGVHLILIDDHIIQQRKLKRVVHTKSMSSGRARYYAPSCIRPAKMLWMFLRRKIWKVSIQEFSYKNKLKSIWWNPYWAIRDPHTQDLDCVHTGVRGSQNITECQHPVILRKEMLTFEA